MTTYRIRKTGSDSNGGTSNTVRSSGSDAIVTATAGTSLVTSITGAWTAADIGHAINVATRCRLITAVAVQTTKTATTTNGSASMTSAAQFDASMVGQAVTGPGIATNTIINTFTDASHVTLSGNAGVGAGTGTVTFYPCITTVTQVSEQVFQTGSGQAWVVGGAWLTLNQNLNNNNNPIKPGDSVYVGAGIYRETVGVTASKSGTAGNLVSLIGDYDGAVTGDIGEVQVTAFIAGDTAIGTLGTVIALTAISYFVISWITVISAGTSVGITIGTTPHDISIADCIVLSQGGSPISFTGSAGNSTAYNFTIDRCAFFCTTASSLTLNLNSAVGVPDYDANILVRNSLLWAVAGANFTCTNMTHAGGIRVYGCTLIASTNGFAVANPASKIYPSEIRNCVVVAGQAAVSAVAAANLGALVEDYNDLMGSTLRTQVNVGPNSRPLKENSNLNLSAGGFDIGQSLKIFGIARPLFSPTYAAAAQVGFVASRTGGPPGAYLSPTQKPPGSPGWRPPALNIAPPDGTTERIGAQPPQVAVDFFNRPRPAGGQSNVISAGYVEFHDTLARDTVTFDVTPASGKFVGAGDHDLLVPVDAGSQTFSIRCLYDTLYQGPNPPTFSIIANAEIGVTAQTVAAAADARGTWQTITLAAINPTAAGVIRIRLASLDAGGASQVNFDTFAVA